MDVDSGKQKSNQNEMDGSEGRPLLKGFRSRGQSRSQSSLVSGSDNRTAADASVADEEKGGVHSVLVDDDALPWFYRTFPVTRVEITKCALMVGNNALPNFLVGTFTNAQILHAAEKRNSQTSLYCLMTKMKQVNDMEIYLQRNPDYVSEAELRRRKRNQDEIRRDLLSQAMRRFDKIGFDIIQEDQIDEEDPRKYHRPRRRNSVPSIDQTKKKCKRRASMPSEEKMMVFECDRVEFEHVYEYPRQWSREDCTPEV